jgi:hypothetical protein
MRTPSAAVLALILASPLFAQATERLASPALNGFVVGYSAANTQQSIREEVPRGETVEAWTRMVTTQRFVGLAARATPAQYAQNVIAPLPRACPGARVSPIENLTVTGRPAVRLQVDCPRNGGGQPEMFILLAIGGLRDMHVKQVAFRGALTAANMQWAQGYLAATALCGPGNKEAVCRR